MRKISWHFPRWSVAPEGTPPVQRRNFLNVQIDGVGVGLAASSAPFLPVFLARLGGSNFEVGLLTAMPALTGLILALPVGRFLQSRRRIVPWFSLSRLLVVSSYVLTGLAPFIVPQPWLVRAVLIIWALATLPQTSLNVTFSVVMNAVAGPQGRYDLMSRRWTILGLTMALTVAAVSEVLDLLVFPINYQAVFLGLSLGGLISYYFSSHIELPDAEPALPAPGAPWRARLQAYIGQVLGERRFVSFVLKRFVFLTGTSLATPLFPLYYVRVVQASDWWIGVINTAQMAVLLFGYFFWVRQSRRRGSHFVLLASTLAMSLYPAVTALTTHVQVVALIAGFSGIFQAGIDLVFFDELMKTVPPAHTATFVSMAQMLTYLSTMLAPVLGTMLADRIGLAGALAVAAGVRLLGFLLFALPTRLAEPAPSTEPAL
jgi:MFS family permease